MTTLRPETSDISHKDDASTTDSASLGTTQVANSINNRNWGQNAALPALQAPVFKSTTIAPSPPLTLPANANLLRMPSRIDTSELQYKESSGHSSPQSAGLRLQTDIPPSHLKTTTTDEHDSLKSPDNLRKPTKSIAITRTPSVKQVLAHSFGSSSNIGSAPNSALSSPLLSAMSEVTPLPSPLLSGDSPGPWNRLGSRPGSRELAITPFTADAALVTASGESISSAIANQSKRRAYHSLLSETSPSALLNNADANREKNTASHRRNRSLSEYTPEAAQIKPRLQTVSGSHAIASDTVNDSLACSEIHMRREPHLALMRGIAPIPRPPTPPSSRTGGESSDSDSSLTSSARRVIRTSKKPRSQYFDAHTRHDGKRRRWRAIKLLGEGTFSKVILATSQLTDEEDRIDEDDVFGDTGVAKPIRPRHDFKKLVAIKICEHGPKGGASEERVEMSLKRELEIMKSINHPSLVHLKAWNIEDTRAILVLGYSPGGDLFEVASEHRDVLVPSLLRRIFAELIGAIQYLHERHIVHRDIKLENVLVNLPHNELAKPMDWATYPYSVVTLTDLGLSRRVADDEKLTTRCGSDDYAAPEVIMGQPYDGRAVDAWSLGVLLYALLESRLPFDPNPGAPESHKQRSRTSHRIARVEWRWIEYAGEDGDHEGDIVKFETAGLKGAMEVTENLLKRARSRWTIGRIAQEEWVREAIQVEGGIRFREEDNPEEVLTPPGT